MGEFVEFEADAIISYYQIGERPHTITYKSRLTQKKLHKKTDAIFSIYGKNGIIPWHFFWILT